SLVRLPAVPSPAASPLPPAVPPLPPAVLPVTAALALAVRTPLPGFAAAAVAGLAPLACTTTCASPLRLANEALPRGGQAASRQLACTSASRLLLPLAGVAGSTTLPLSASRAAVPGRATSARRTCQASPCRATR